MWTAVDRAGERTLDGTTAVDRWLNAVGWRFDEASARCVLADSFKLSGRELAKPPSPSKLT